MKAGFNSFIQFATISYTVICLTIALFLPASFSLILDNLLFPFALFHLGVVFLNRKEYRVLIGIFSVFFIWTFISEYISNKSISFSNIYYLLYFLKWPVLIFSFVDNKFATFEKWKLNRIVDGIFILLVAMNLLMLINPFGLGQSLQLIYSPKELTNFVYYNESGTFRLSGTCMDPNNNGAIFGSFFLYYFILRSKETWTLSALALFLVLMTQSRTAFLGLIFIFIIWAILKVFRNGISKKQISLLLVGLIILFGISLFSNNLRSIFSGKAFVSQSFSLRYSYLMDFVESDDFNHFIGNGVVENAFKEFGFYLDSEIVAVLFQFGIVGLILWILLFAYTIFFFRIKQRRSYFWGVYLVFIGILSITNFTLLNSQFGVVLSVFLGLGLFIEEKYLNTTAIKKPVIAP